ncbi:superantigen-like protein [Staphylococcus aureus]|nr:superantigen-like protein [Staphylococcus aureus]MBH4541984.1 superantigen-like protein [Staphylococcus aureus]MBH4546782.1 superantigen-like protein [Staphylococcus aureus]MBH4552212.1 superantigen-like protein [Staphylococcus aureus]MBH4554727.1 superantigen-like protein [Staphylococcus aureus]
MKLKNIAKASLALGILTTGMITTTAQPVKAESMDSSIVGLTQNDKSLGEYYNGPSFDLKNASGYKEGNIANIIDRSQLTEVKLLGRDKERIKDLVSGEFDVFIVREGTGKQATNYSIGGITKSNTNNNKDQVSNPRLYVTQHEKNYSYTQGFGNIYIYKEEISLKELDFKLRKKLIDEYGLYTKRHGSGKIVVLTDNGGKYTFDLSKKLQVERMGDVIDGTKIKEINVELN